MTLHKKPVYIVAAFVFFIMHIALFAEKPKDVKHVFSYRGMRMSNMEGLFYVTKIETETEHAGMLPSMRPTAGALWKCLKKMRRILCCWILCCRS